MTKKRMLVFVTLTVLLLQVALSQTTQSNAIYNNNFSNNTKSEIDPSIKYFTPNTPPGTEVVKANIFKDGACEEENANEEPSGFYGWGSGHSSANFSYQDEVHAGSYGACLSARGTSQYQGDISESRYFEYIPERSYLDEDITMDFWFNAKANPDITQYGYMRIYLRLTTNLGNYYLYYLLSIQNIGGVNGTQQGYYDIRAPLNTWTHITRNVTDDLVQAVTVLPDLSVSYIRYFYINCNSPEDATGDTVLLLDDVSFTNGTSFNYFADNGDFEDGDSNPWGDSGSGPGYCTLTEDDKTQGNSAMNLTAHSPYSYTRSYIGAEKDLYNGWGTVPKGYVPLQPGDFVFSFDWKYSDMANGLGEQIAYFYISMYNETYNSYLQYNLGNEDDVIPNSNYTTATYSSYYFAADGLGTRDVWNTLTIDCYDVLTALNFTNLPIFYIGFYLEADDTEDLTVQLLVDNFQMVTYPAGNPGFETDFEFNAVDPLRLWNTNYNDNYVNITIDAHSGDFAANVTAYGGIGTRYAYRQTFLPVTNNLFTDFWWRLDKISPSVSGQAYSYIRLELDDSNLLYYMLGSNGMVFVNQSNQCYYNVDEHNLTGIWNNLFRNLTEDVAYFGAEIHNITEIRIVSYTTGAAEIVSIVDDLHFATDVTGPTLTNLIQDPATPQYLEEVTISVEASDNFAIDTVNLHYSIDSGSWNIVPMLHGFGEYYEVIPFQVYNTAVEYYIEAIDVNGLLTNLGSQVTPYSYVVADLIDPILYIWNPPLTSETLEGNALFDIDAMDIGSGISKFEIRIDDEIVLNETLPPMQFTWDTENYENGDYTISFYLWDGAENDVELHLEYTIYNPPTQWEAFTAFMQQWGPYIGGGAGGLAIIVVVLVVVLRRKKGI
ncbi:MAG: hypothetical protein ACTSO7_11745 [Candidatus Heimdallarchaeota archaeon]